LERRVEGKVPVLVLVRLAPSVDWGPRGHGTTHTRKAITRAAAVASIGAPQRDKVPENPSPVGDQLLERLKNLHDEPPLPSDANGRGTFAGTESAYCTETEEPATEEDQWLQ